MKKITKEEFDKLTFKQQNPIVKAIMKLNVGEMLMVSNGDYTGKSHFRQWIGSAANCYNGALKKAKIKVSVKTLVDGSGWVIIRIK